MQVALVHDWLTALGGAEKVLEAFLDIFPADLFTLVKDPAILAGTLFEKVPITTSFIQKLPAASRKYRSYFPLFPLAIEQFDVSRYNLVISSSHSAAKGVLTHADQLHICYCHTPMRYAWDLYHQYLQKSNLDKGIKGAVARWLLHRLRLWDTQSASRVNCYVANSQHVARRIKKIYGRDATVIHPPVAVDSFLLEENKENYYLTTSRLVPYKRVDLIVEAFSAMPDKKLVVIGDGPELGAIKQKAKSNVEILGFQTDAALRTYFQKAKGFVFAALEDFGIVCVEAQACGTPVIAFGRGGALETVIDNQTGVFFPDQTVSSLIEAIQSFERKTFDPKLIRSHAETFRQEIFRDTFQTFVQSAYDSFMGDKPLQ